MERNRKCTVTSRGGVLLLLAAALLLQSPPARVQCKPTPGLFLTAQNFHSNPTFTAAPYALTKTTSQIEVKRSGAQIYIHQIPTGFISTYLFYGTNNPYLLIKDVRTGTVNVTYALTLVNLSTTPSPAEFPLQSADFFVIDIPQLHVQPSAGNGQAVFSFFGARDQVQNLEIRCSDTGALMCATIPFHPAQQILAEATSTSVRIKEGGATKKECPLPPVINVSPVSLDFGSVMAGTSSPPKSVTIKNDGSSALTFGVGVTNTKFAASPSTGNLSGGRSQDVSVRFATSSSTPVGPQNGRLTITHNDPNKPSQTVSLTASVTAAESRIDVSPLSLAFGNVAVGTTSASSSVVIRNTGGAALTFAVMATNAMFSLSPASGTVAPGGSQVLSVRFTAPSGAPLGLQSGSLNITHNDPTKPAQVVSASATVVLPRPSVVPGAVEHYETSSGRFIRYRLVVTNWQTYPDAMFAKAPDLPPCGRNTNSSRTWVDIYVSATRRRLYGFCALTSAQDLQRLWFAVREGTAPPASVYIVLIDRRTNTSHRSADVAIP